MEQSKLNSISAHEEEHARRRDSYYSGLRCLTAPSSGSIRPRGVGAPHYHGLAEEACDNAVLRVEQCSRVRGVSCGTRTVCECSGSALTSWGWRCRAVSSLSDFPQIIGNRASPPFQALDGCSPSCARSLARYSLWLER